MKKKRNFEKGPKKIRSNILKYSQFAGQSFHFVLHLSGCIQGFSFEKVRIISKHYFFQQYYVKNYKDETIEFSIFQ